VCDVLFFYPLKSLLRIRRTHIQGLKSYNNVIFDKKTIEICKRNYITESDNQKLLNTGKQNITINKIYYIALNKT